MSLGGISPAGWERSLEASWSLTPQGVEGWFGYRNKISTAD